MFGNMIYCAEEACGICKQLVWLQKGSLLSIAEDCISKTGYSVDEIYFYKWIESISHSILTVYIIIQVCERRQSF